MRKLFLALIASLALGVAACAPGADQPIDPVDPVQPGAPSETDPGLQPMPTDDGFGDDGFGDDGFGDDLLTPAP